MKKRVTLIILILIVIAFVGALSYLYTKNQQSPVVYTTQLPEMREIIKKTVATGSILPKEEIIIKPNISGIIDRLYVEAGDRVKSGDLIAKIKVIPNAASLSSAKNKVKEAKATMENQQKNFARQKMLLDKAAISQKDFEAAELSFKQAQIGVKSAVENYEIIKTGTTTGLGNTSNTLVRSTVTGMVLEVPVKVGNQVIEANNFNEGTTIASLADVNNMIFDGNLDESEIGKVKEMMSMEVTVGAIPEDTFEAVLDYIAPKGVTENGAVQFQIKGTLKQIETFIRPGLSANASIILEKTDGKVLSISESLLQYDKEQNPFVEVKIGDQEFEKRMVEIGVRDGLFAQIISGVDEEDEIKVWSPSANSSSESDKKKRKPKR